MKIMENPNISRLKTLFLFAVLFLLTAILLIMYNCVSGQCGGRLMRRDISVYVQRKHRKYRMGKHLSFLSYPIQSQNSRSKGNAENSPSFEDFSKQGFKFDIRSNDVIVFLQIQNTGGLIFSKHLTSDLLLDKPCACNSDNNFCHCERPNKKNSYWLFSHQSIGWKCGIHADWTELTNCVDKVLDVEEGSSLKRRYFYVTLLRHPVERFLSEYRHLKNIKEWTDTHHMCGGEKWVLPSCFDRSKKSLKIQKFLACHNNLAANRQTRMLADLPLVGCYDKEKLSQEEHDTVLLASAKNNLRKMAFFGLADQQFKSQIMFEKTFDLHFMRNFQQKNKTVGSKVLHRLSDEILEEVKRANYLDIQLYTYAKKLFNTRFKALRKWFPDLDDYSLNSDGLQPWVEDREIF